MLQTGRDDRRKRAMFASMTEPCTENRPFHRATIEVEGGALSLLKIRHEGAPHLLFVHANGFNAQTYLKMLTQLSDRFEITAPDMRGQGMSTADQDPESLRDWHIYAQDIAAVAAGLDGRPLYLAGHSMGAACGLLAAAFHGLTARRMAFIEPIFMPTGFYAIPHIPGGAYLYQFNPMSNAARRRRPVWQSRDEAAASYREKRLFADWAPGVLEDYLETGLRASGSAWRLSCTPALEAANFASHGHDPWAALGRTGPDIPMLKAGRPGSTVYTGWRLKKRGVPLEIATDRGHLMPMTHPSECAEWFSARLMSAGA